MRVLSDVTFGCSQQMAWGGRSPSKETHRTGKWMVADDWEAGGGVDLRCPGIFLGPCEPAIPLLTYTPREIENRDSHSYL